MNDWFIIYTAKFDLAKHENCDVPVIWIDICVWLYQLFTKKTTV